MKKRILLVSPNAKGLEDKIAYPPLGLLYLASNMTDEWQPEVKICLDDTFTEFDYEFYGISVHSVAVVKETLRLIDLIIMNNPKAKIYVGGGASSLIEDSKNVWVLPGECESFFGEKDISNLDTINYPARNLLPHKYIHYKGKVHHTDKPATTIIATRGCIYNCSFCDRITMGRSFRKRSIANVAGEVESLINDYGIQRLRFIDDCLTINKTWFLDLCEKLKEYKIEWTCLSRSDLLDMNMLKKMKESGCKEIFFGFESGSQKMLNAMNKRMDVTDNVKIIDMCNKAGIDSCAYMMFGFPGEDEVSVIETIQFLDKAKPTKSRISTFVPIPGTDVWNNPTKYNVKIKNNYEDFWYFDTKDFGLDYTYIGNDKMSELKDKMIGYYEKKYSKGWDYV